MYTNKDENIKPTCRYCGSDRLLFDAVAKWSVERQMYEMVDVHDNVDCEQCKSETSVLWRPA